MPRFPEPAADNDYLADHVAILCDSFRRWTGRALIDRPDDRYDAARRLYFAPFALLSHAAGDDPIFNYANRTALQLFEMSWEELTALPSRRSAEPVQQERRAQLLSEVAQKGYIENYRGVRIASSGRRFLIEDATVWNMVTRRGTPYGQAAMFSVWLYL
jgi:hypothetical protein